MKNRGRLSAADNTTVLSQNDISREENSVDQCTVYSSSSIKFWGILTLYGKIGFFVNPTDQQDIKKVRGDPQNVSKPQQKHDQNSLMIIYKAV